MYMTIFVPLYLDAFKERLERFKSCQYKCGKQLPFFVSCLTPFNFICMPHSLLCGSLAKNLRYFS